MVAYHNVNFMPTASCMMVERVECHIRAKIT
jgi:hypothetical protein